MRLIPLFCLLAAIGCGHDTSDSTDGGSDGNSGSADLAHFDASASNDSATGDGGFQFPTPIHHVIVIVKENHTFDNYFGAFPGAEGNTTCPLPNGTGPCPVAPDRTPRDMCHEHECGLTDWNQGAMDGWSKDPNSSMNNDNLAWAQYNEAGIPNYWAYAKSYALADHFFADEIGPSFPGHMFTIAAQAGWAFDNPYTNPLEPVWGCSQPMTDTVDIFDKGTCTMKAVRPCFDIPSLPDVLPKELNWTFYGTNYFVFPDIWSMFNAIDPIRNGPGWKHVVDMASFKNDVKNGTLANLVWLVPQDLNDEHPGIGGVCAGENFTVDLINTIMQTAGTANDYWKDTAILFTMDDFGGWYDHVPPPRQYGCDPQHPYGLGFRLPLILISPYAKPHTIFKEVSEHASIARFIEKVFGAPALSTLDPAAQDGQANDLLNAFDWNQTPNPPLVLQQRTCL
jgi:phospholipase C